MREPTRKDILDEISEHLCRVIQWSEHASWYEHAIDYHHRAGALIDLLEAHDCGSCGGFDAGQPRAKNLADRWCWLYKKYDRPKDNKNYNRIVRFFAKH